MVELSNDEIRVSLKRRLEELELDALRRWGLRGQRQFVAVLDHYVASRLMHKTWSRDDA
jgi:hypothetical protein